MELESVTGHAVPVWPFPVQAVMDDIRYREMHKWGELSPTLQFFGFTQRAYGTVREVYLRRQQDFVIKRNANWGRATYTPLPELVAHLRSLAPEHRTRIVPTWRCDEFLIQRYAGTDAVRFYEVHKEVEKLRSTAHLCDLIADNIGWIGNEWYVIDCEVIPPQWRN